MTNPTQTADKTDFLTLLRQEFPAVEGQPVDMLPIIWRVAETLTTFGGIAVTYPIARRECLNGLISGQYAGVLKYKLIMIEVDDAETIKNLIGIRASVQEEINRLEDLARHARGIGVIDVVAERRGYSHRDEYSG